VICKLQHIYVISGAAFTSMMRIMQPANQGLACRIPCCPVVWWQSGLFSASAVNVRVAHEYKRAIQSCNTHLCCIVVTSWHGVLHHKLAIKIETVSCPCNTCFWYALTLVVRNTSRGAAKWRISYNQRESISKNTYCMGKRLFLYLY